MASVDSSNWALMANPLVPKPTSLMLKDFLRDDMSSCSSNGFRSFPRRQCCATTVRFLLEIDLKLKDSSVTTKTPLPRTASRKIALSTISTLQRASDTVVRVFKQFPLPSSRKPFLPRSISRKLILRAFWKKSDIVVVDPNSTRPWKSFREFLDEKEPDSSHQNRSDSAVSVCTAISVAGRNSTASSCCNSISWTESEFTSEMIPSSSSGNSESCSENDAVKDDKESQSSSNLIGKRDGVTFGNDSMEETTTATTTAYREEIVKQWPNEEEKEQFSPVSVLDFPFDDEDQDISSSFNCNLHLVEGKKQKHTQKTKRLEKEAELEPVDLKKRFAGISHRRQDFSLISKKEHQREQKAFELLKLLKSTTESQCFIFKTENLLLDFFHEKLEENEATAARRSGRDNFEAQVILNSTEDWINGDAGEITVLEWELPEGRNLYIKDMETMAGKWRSFAEEKEGLAAEFEAEVWISLLNELLIDLS